AAERRIQTRVREAEVEQVQHRLLPEIVVDSEDRRLGEDGVKRVVERACGSEVMAKRLLDRDAGVGAASRFAEVADDLGEGAGRDGEVMQRALRLAHLAAQGGEGSLVGIIAVDVTQEGAQLLEGAAIEAAVMREAVPGACAELLDRPCGLGDADDGYV